MLRLQSFVTVTDFHLSNKFGSQLREKSKSETWGESELRASLFATVAIICYGSDYLLR